jgi:tRNA/rRNA methyltransferase
VTTDDRPVGDGTPRKVAAPLPGAPAPVVILVEPQLGENIGTASRAMLNCGLWELRLVRPRDAWPNPRAFAASSRADKVLENARVFERTEDAIADLNRVYATTARNRDLLKHVVTPRAAARDLRARVADGQRVGLMFGPERTGLENHDLSLADQLLTVPLNPDFDSLNLAQAVLLIGWEWWTAADATPDEVLNAGRTRPATKADLIGLFHHLEAELDAQNLRNLFERAGLMEQDVRTLRGVIKALAVGRPARQRIPRKRGQIGAG